MHVRIVPSFSHVTLCAGLVHVEQNIAAIAVSMPKAASVRLAATALAAFWLATSARSQSFKLTALLCRGMRSTVSHLLYVIWPYFAST